MHGHGSQGKPETAGNKVQRSHLEAAAGLVAHEVQQQNGQDERKENLQPQPRLHPAVECEGTLHNSKCMIQHQDEPRMCRRLRLMYGQPSPA